jgi:hypothetical protein
VQVTDANGECTFTTIYPGCYSGRYPHIHFEVYSSLGMATLYTNRILTSQMAMPRDISSSVYNSATGYSQSVTNLAQVTTSNDNVFGDNTAAQITQMTPTLSGDASAGFTGTFLIGVPEYRAVARVCRAPGGRAAYTSPDVLTRRRNAYRDGRAQGGALR